MPATSGTSGPTTVRSTRLDSAKRGIGSKSGSPARFVATCAMPGLPGAAIDSVYVPRSRKGARRGRARGPAAYDQDLQRIVPRLQRNGLSRIRAAGILELNAESLRRDRGRRRTCRLRSGARVCAAGPEDRHGHDESGPDRADVVQSGDRRASPRVIWFAKSTRWAA